MMNIIKKCWRGEEDLWKVFWLYGVLAAIIIQILPVVVLVVDKTFGIIFFGVCALISIPYAFWSLVSTWRCAFNVRIKFWGYLARFYVVVLSFIMIILLLLGVNNSIAVAECRKEIAPMAAAAGVDYKTYKQQYPDQLPEKCRPRTRLPKTLNSGE